MLLYDIDMFLTAIAKSSGIFDMNLYHYERQRHRTQPLLYLPVKTINLISVQQHMQEVKKILILTLTRLQVPLSQVIYHTSMKEPP